MKRHHFKFESRFVDRVADGSKACTIRATRKRPAVAGDVIVLTHWFGKAYRSPSITIGEAVLKAVRKIEIFGQDARALCVELDGEYLDIQAIDDLARKDGFEGWADFHQFFRPRFPFSGHLYEWEPLTK